MKATKKPPEVGLPVNPFGASCDASGRKQKMLNIFAAIDPGLNWLFAGVIAFVLSCTWLLDGPSEVQAMQDAAATVADAQQQARQTARFDRAARRLCAGGEYLLIGRAEIACTDGAGGRKVLSVKVAL